MIERYGSVLRLSLPPKNGCEQPIPSDPDTIRQSRSHRWRTMMDSGLILDSQTAMGSAKVVLHHREPTHPAVISARLGKRQGLSHLTLIVEAGPAIFKLHHTRIDLVIAQQRQGMLELGLAPNHLEVNPIAGGFNNLPIRQPLGPPNHRVARASPQS